MLHNDTKSWIIAACLVALLASFWAMSGSASAVALTAITIIGLLPPLVLMVLARNPEPTMAESIRAVVARRVK